MLMARLSRSDGLFPGRKVLLAPGRRPDPKRRILESGPYESYDELLETHIELLSEDLILALREQIDDLRRYPRLLATGCYNVRGSHIVTKETRSFREETQVGIEFTFNANQYQDVKWDEDRRFLTGNLVFVSDSDMKDFVLGIVHDSGPRLLRSGRVVIKLVDGVDIDGAWTLLDHSPYVKKTFKLVESGTFYFPYLHVTNVLRKDIKSSGRMLLFEDEIVYSKLPSRRPRYGAYVLTAGQDGRAAELLEEFRLQLNASQMQALESVLARRVALVQGPPGTGKTFLGVKLAQYFVALKKDRRFRHILPGPVLVVTTTNHAVHEFLTRCTSFSDKIVHGYSDHHEQTSYGELQERYDASQRGSRRTEIMAEADILAMTTTRAAFMRPTLDGLRVRIMIVEEAAEAPEAYILACIPQGTEHIIQIGDHKQLRPNVAFQPLAATHRTDLSLFERLINNGAECPMLNEQRRMRPAVADLVRPIYPALTDHPSTCDRPPIAGVALDEPVFFVSHSVPETPDGKGFSNSWEAEMAAELAAFLVHCGLEPSKVTVLTTYRRQLQLILNHMRQIGEASQGIRVTTVDNFQGEENSVIILSLVRSNDKGGVGFLHLENRACVALSRARDGFFLLGNLSCLTSSGAAVWGHVRDALARAGRLGGALPLLVDGKKLLASSGADVRRARTTTKPAVVKRDAAEPGGTKLEAAEPGKAKLDAAAAAASKGSKKMSAPEAVAGGDSKLAEAVAGGLKLAEAGAGGSKLAAAASGGPQPAGRGAKPTEVAAAAGDGCRVNGSALGHLLGRAGGGLGRSGEHQQLNGGRPGRASAPLGRGRQAPSRTATQPLAEAAGVGRGCSRSVLPGRGHGADH